MSPRDRPTTQLQRVIKAARAFNGTCQADWLAEVTPDGGPRITRVAARLQEAEDRLGCCFEHIGWRDKTKIFRLISGPEVEVERGAVVRGTNSLQSDPAGLEPGGSPSLSSETEPLFETPVETSHWREEAA
jgi:hypothetical protein